MDYKNENAQVMFEVAEQTVRNWSAEFAKYLSPTANPEKGATRLFTRDDMKALSLVAEMRGQGKKYDAIGVALENGQRGSLPDLSDNALIELSGSEYGIELANENRELKLKIMELKTTIDASQEIGVENIRLQERVAQRDELIADLKARLLEMEAKWTANMDRIGSEYTRGVMETLTRLGKLSGGDDA